MGFGWTGTCFMRISGQQPFKVEIYPSGLIPNSVRKKDDDLHWVWWEECKRDIIKLLPVARCKAKRHFICYVNDDGQIV